MSCEFCSNYYLNSHDCLDDCCLGKGDCRKEYFSCNSDLAPKTEKTRTRKEFVKGYNQALEDVYSIIISDIEDKEKVLKIQELVFAKKGITNSESERV